MFKAAAPTHCEFIKHLGLRKAASEVAEFTNSTIRSHWHFALHHIQNKSQFVGTAIRRPQLSAWFSMTFTTCACFQDYAGPENVHFKSNEFPWFSSIVWTLNTWATWLNRVMDLVGGESHHWTFWELEHLSVSYFTMHMLTTGTMIHSLLLCDTTSCCLAFPMKNAMSTNDNTGRTQQKTDYVWRTKFN